jgi:starch synthase
MIAMRYGTVPIVRETGGLRDTVHNLGGEGENGFSFVEYSTNGLLGAVDFALRIWQNDQGTWQRLIAADMTADLGWDASAARYIDIYNCSRQLKEKVMDPIGKEKTLKAAICDELSAHYALTL